MAAADELDQHDKHKHRHTGVPSISDHNKSHNVAAGGIGAADLFDQHDKHHHTGLPGTSDHTNALKISDHTNASKISDQSNASGFSDHNKSHNVAAGGIGAAIGLHKHDKHHNNQTSAPGISDHTCTSKLSDHNTPYNAPGGTQAADAVRRHGMHSHTTSSGDKHHHTGVPDDASNIDHCIRFLATIKRVDAVDKIKDDNKDTSYLMNVILANYDDAKGHTTPSSFQIKRTFKEFKELQHEAEHWSNKHEHRGCTYCPFFESAHLPNVFKRIVASKDKMEREMEDFLFSYVVNARRPRSIDMECQGYSHIPTILTRFITRDLPTEETDAQPDLMQHSRVQPMTMSEAGKQAVTHGEEGAAP